jgi:hypothetical protein
VGEPQRQFAIVSQKQQTFSLRIETSDIEKSREFFGQEIKDRVARVEIFSSRNESVGFMQHNRQRRSGANKFITDFDVVARCWLRTEVCADLAIDCDAARTNQLIAMPTGTKTSSSKEAVQAHGAFVKALSGTALMLQAFTASRA